MFYLGTCLNDNMLYILMNRNIIWSIQVPEFIQNVELVLRLFGSDRSYIINRRI